MKNPYRFHGLTKTCSGADHFGKLTFLLTHHGHGGKYCRAVTTVEAGSSKVLAMGLQHLYGMTTGFQMGNGL